MYDSEISSLNNREIPATLFVTGIGTDVGKSYATGWLARTLQSAGHNVITQKFIQTGNLDTSEDILIHRKIMRLPLLDVDLQHITAPVIYTYPASPDLAARIDKRPLDLSLIDNATETLHNDYDTVIVEGAGGIMVPLNDTFLTIDYINQRHLPTVVVTNGKLGSVSDTLLTLEAIHSREIPLFAVIYNPWFDTDKTIADDSRQYLRRHVCRLFPKALMLEMPEVL